MIGGELAAAEGGDAKPRCWWRPTTGGGGAAPAANRGGGGGTEKGKPLVGSIW